MGGQLAINTIQLGSNLVLTRILVPEAFGLMAIVNFVCDGLQQISSIGIQPAVIRSPGGDEPRFVQTAWTLQVLRGLLLFVLGLCVAYPLALFYEEPRLTWLMLAASLGPLLLGLQSIHWATTARALQLERPMAIQVGARLFAAVTTVAFAAALQSVWALVIGVIAGNVVRVGLSHTVLPGDRCRLQWDPDSAREILRFGKWILVSTFLGFVAIRLDVALIGRLLPLEIVGVYSIGVLVPNIIRQLAAIGIQRVLMPALAEVHRQEASALDEALRTSRRLLLAAGSLLVVSCVAVAPAFFTFLYDARYHDAAWIAQLAAIGLWLGFLQDTSGRALLVLGHSRAWATSEGLRTLGTLGGALAGFALGDLPGLLVGLGLGSGAGYLALCHFLARLGIRILPLDLLYTAVTALAACAIGLGPRLLPALAVPEPLLVLALSLVYLIPCTIFTARRVLMASRDGGAAEGGPSDG